MLSVLSHLHRPMLILCVWSLATLLLKFLSQMPLAEEGKLYIRAQLFKASLT